MLVNLIVVLLVTACGHNNSDVVARDEIDTVETVLELNNDTLNIFKLNGRWKLVKVVHVKKSTVPQSIDDVILTIDGLNIKRSVGDSTYFESILEKVHEKAYKLAYASSHLYIIDSKKLSIRYYNFDGHQEIYLKME